MAAAAQQPVFPQVVANAFVEQYYRILHQSPALVHKFYQDISQLGRPSVVDGSMTISTTMQAINEKILSQDNAKFRSEIKTVDAQGSCNGGVHVLVTGYLVGKDNVIQNFTQSFFLATQEKGYFVLNDILRYTGDGNNSTEITVSSNNVEDRSTPQQDPSPVKENEQIVGPVNVENAIDTAENGEENFVNLQKSEEQKEQSERRKDDDELWVEATGGPKSGGVFGMGYVGRMRSLLGWQSNPHLTLALTAVKEEFEKKVTEKDNIIEELRADIELLKASNEEIKADVKTTKEEMRSELEATNRRMALLSEKMELFLSMPAANLSSIGSQTPNSS